MYVKAAIGCGNAVSLKKKPPRRQPWSWLKQSSNFLVCVIYIFRQCKNPRKCRKYGFNNSHNALLHGAERVFPAKPSNDNINNSKSNADTSTPNTGQQQPSKTTTLSSVTIVKRHLQVTELKLTISSGFSTMALVLCDNACSNFWVSDGLAARLGLQGTAFKLTVKGINTEKTIDTKDLQLTLPTFRN